MKFVVLHGTRADHTHSWFPWLKERLEEKGHEVWVPDLPGADRPNPKRYNKFLLGSGWNFDNNVIIGHSSGSVEILHLLQALPEDININTGILVGSFTSKLAESPSFGMLRGLFDVPFDFETIKKKSKKFIFIHSEDDPYCPIGQAESLHEKLGGEFIRFKDKGHFTKSLDPQFDKFPELLDIIEQKVL